MPIRDDRAPIETLYTAYRRLSGEFGWIQEVVYQHDGLPMLVFATPQTGAALWILAGIHGEEPAGPNALARNIETIARYGQAFPMVLFPLCNPWGYVKGWRYPNEERDWQKGESVSDASHVLTGEKSNPIAEALIAKVEAFLKPYPPLLSIDHHEDEALPEGYVYSQGSLGAQDPVALRIVELLRTAGIPIQQQGTTRFGETVERGVIGPVRDSSIDELLAARGAKTVIVVETPTIGIPLETRVNAHAAIIQEYDKLRTPSI